MNDMRTWVDISLGNIVHNYREIRRLVGKERLIMAVVKADAYGHGARTVSQVLEKAGVDRFAVATIQEAVDLRAAGIGVPIMILGASSDGQVRQLLENDIIQTVYDLDMAKELSLTAENLGRRLKVHVKVDTGMSRLGFEAPNDKELDKVTELCSLDGLEVEGIFTHFATSEVPGDPFPKEQLDRFITFCESLERKGVHIPVRHASNSGAVINVKESYLDLVRPGLALYGLYPGPGLGDLIDLRPAMQLRAQIVRVHDYTGPITVSYGRKFASKGPIRTATVAIGYADGLFRTLSGKMDMLLKGKRVRQIGSICMDMCMIDVTGIPDVRAGDTVTIFGNDNGEEITVDEIADLAGTIPYEIVCALSGRVGRRYADER